MLFYFYVLSIPYSLQLVVNIFCHIMHESQGRSFVFPGKKALGLGGGETEFLGMFVLQMVF